MKKRLLAEGQMNSVLRLRQTGASWMRIQRESGVPRRVAQRAYEDWQKAQSFTELKESRRTVAAEEFRDHVESLAKLGTFLAMNLDIPYGAPAKDAPSGLQIVDKLWEANVLGEAAEEPAARWSPLTGAGRHSDSVVRRHKKLYRSLLEHTRVDLRWETLQEWQEAWDQCRGTFAEVRETAAGVVGNFLRREQELVARLKKSNHKGDPIAQIIGSLLEVVWSEILEGKLAPDGDVFVVKTARGFIEVSAGGISVPSVPALADESLAERVAWICNQALKNVVLRDGDKLIEILQGQVKVMRAKVMDLADMLDPVVVRPIILRTRCDLCPA